MQSVPLDQAQELSYLVRLCLASHILQVEERRHVGMREDVMAAPATYVLEAEPFRKVDDVAESDILNRPGEEPPKQPPPVHVTARCPEKRTRTPGRESTIPSS